MFYSTEVLRNNRSSLGMIWSAAWGRRLARSRVLNINIDQTCEQLMDPEVPQALRLQAILASGIVKIHEKKVDYLKEDAEHAMRTLCETGAKGKRSIDLDEKRSRKKKTTIISSQFETRQPLELFFGPSGFEANNDFHFGESYDGNTVHDDYFIPQSLDPELVMSFPFDEGMDQRNYIMDSPDNIPDFDDPRISDGFQDHHHDMGSPMSVCDQEKIIIKPRRKRRPKMDQGIIDMSSSVNDASSRLRDHQDGSQYERKMLCRKFASFSSPHDKNGCLDACLEKIHINKKTRTVFTQYPDIDKGPQEGGNHDVYDPKDYGYDEREVEIEKLRDALHMTPNEKMGFLRTSNSKSLPNSSGDLSREETGYLSNRSSVQKDRLSGLFKESRHDLENDVYLGHQSSPDEVPFSNLDNFKLKETGSSQSLLESYGRLQEWDKSSHTMEILTKAKLCSKRWGAASILLLDDLTCHLNRHEAAAMFHHILVGSSSGLIKTHQAYAYGPITIEFDF